jgi:hypothetical protein
LTGTCSITMPKQSNIKNSLHIPLYYSP